MKIKKLKESFEHYDSAFLVYMGTSSESLNNYMSGMGDACKDMKGGDVVFFKDYEIDGVVDETGKFYYYVYLLDDSLNDEDLHESYDNAERLANLLAKPLRLSKYEKEMFEHDINNLRADEWLELVKSLPEKTPGREEFIKLFDKENLEESTSGRYTKSDIDAIADFLDVAYKFDSLEDKYKCVCDILDNHTEDSSPVEITEKELVKFAKLHNGKKIKKINESLGSDYSHIEEVKSIDFSNDKNNNLPGIPNTKKFKNALNSVGQDAFKIRTSRLNGISTADLKDEFGGNGMKPWKFFKDRDNSVKGFNEFYFFYKTDKFPKKSTNEAFDVDKVQKRIAHVDEFDNGRVIHNDWTKMSSQEAEEKAKQMSIENPNKVYYVKYDNVMEPCSDIKWKNGEQLTEDIDTENNKMTVSPMSGLGSDGFDVIITDNNGDELFKKNYRYGYDASYDRRLSNEDKPYHIDIINDLCRKYSINKQDIEVVAGWNTFANKPVHHSYVSSFKDELNELNEDVPMEYTDTSNFKDLQDESDEYQAELKRKNTNRAIMHKVFDKYGLMDSDERWADTIYWLCANAQEIKVVDDASKVPHKTNDGAKIKYVMSTPMAEVDIHADAFKDYLWIVTKDSLEESISFDDNEFFTREEINEAAEKVIEHINETFNEKYILAGTWLEKGIWTVNVQTEDGMYEFETNCQIDMRKVKKPSDIEKFVLPIAADIIEQIKENSESLTEDLSGEYSNKFKKLITKLDAEDNALAPILRDMIRYCKEDDLKDLWNEKDYDKLMPEEDLDESKGKYKIMAFDNKEEFQIGVSNNLKSALNKARHAKEVAYQDAWVVDTATGETVDETLEEDLDVRANTNKVIELAEEGVISWQSIAEASLIYMSEYDVADMARLYNWVEDDEDEDEAPYSVRKVTNEVTELAEEGVISWESIAQAALRYMSEYDVTDMASMYSWIEDEELDESLKEDFEGEPLKGPKEGPEAGISSLLNNAIQDEFSTIQLYNDIAVTARAEGFEDIANAIDAINTDENTHVGQLQDLLKTISPNAEAIDNSIAEI